MATFSTPPTDANQLSGILNVLGVIEDNTQKAIAPKDIRDGFYTLWENSIFKPTTVTGSAIKYIGIDQYQLQDLTDNSIYPKVYFGKKQVSGAFVMTGNLLDDTINTDRVDYFFYNLKDNSLYGYDTSIAILAGTQSFQHGNGQVAAPILKSTVVSSAFGNYINFNITNNSYVTDGATNYGGDINLISNSGYVSVNNFLFPKQSDITAAKDGFVLKYKWSGDGKAYGVWESAFSQSITSINSTGPVTITGNPIVLTGYRLTDANVVATAIGGIRAGETFSNVDVLDVLRRIIYTYVPPSITSRLTLTSTGENVTLLEAGQNVNVDTRLSWNVFINSTHSVPANNVTFTPFSGQVISTPIISGGRSGTNQPQLTVDERRVDDSPPYRIIPFTFSVRDTNPNGPTQTAVSTMKIVLPYFYGTSQTLATTSNAGSGNINLILGANSTAPTNRLKRILVEPIIGLPTYSNNQSLNITTQGLGATPNGLGYIYFGYPSYYPLLKEIRDYNNLVVTNAFTTYSISISDTSVNRWSARPYIFYISNQTSVPFKPIPYQFLFATQS